MDALPQSVCNEGPVLIGREPELSAFTEILEAHSPEFPLPAVVVVSGERGMGKTSLMRVFELRAARAGWKTAYLDLQKPRANETAGVETFCAEVRKKLGFEKDESFVETVPSAVDRRSNTEPNTATDTDFLTSVVEARAAQAGLKTVKEKREFAKDGAPVEAAPFALDRQSNAAPNAPSASVVHATSFAHELSARSRRAPILILIDQFETAHPWARWLSERFLPELKATPARAVVALACHPECSAVLRQPGNRIFDLGKLPEDSLRQRLAGMGRELIPPLTSAELEGYARDPVSRPEIIGSLLRLLELTRRAGGPVSERPEQRQSQ